MDTIRVVLAEDHPVVRMGIRNLLETQPGIDLIAETDNGADAVRIVNELQPHVLVLDMELPVMDGAEVAKTLRQVANPVRILVLSAYVDKEMVLAMLEAGVAGYLIKDEASDTIEEAIRKVAGGENGWVSRQIAARLPGWLAEKNRGEKKLSPREKDVLRLVILGKTNQLIARELNISEKSVEKYLSRIYAKMGVASRTDAAVTAVREKFV